MERCLSVWVRCDCYRSAATVWARVLRRNKFGYPRFLHFPLPSTMHDSGLVFLPAHLSSVGVCHPPLTKRLPPVWVCQRTSQLPPISVANRSQFIHLSGNTGHTPETVGWAGLRVQETWSLPEHLLNHSSYDDVQGANTAGLEVLCPLRPGTLKNVCHHGPVRHRGRTRLLFLQTHFHFGQKCNRLELCM